MSKETKVQKKIALRQLKATYKRDKKRLSLSYREKKAEAKFILAQAKLLQGTEKIRQKQNAKAMLTTIKREYKNEKYRLKCDFLDRKGETVVAFQAEVSPKAEAQPR